MIFTVRQLLKKAYDSVPQESLWKALQHLSVLDKLISLIKSFHEGMRTQLHLQGELLDGIEDKGALWPPYFSICVHAW